jgi:hypothetical protein
MSARANKSEWALVLVFLTLLGVVPVTQTCLELRRGERVQFTDVFRTRPTAQRLRQYEETLKEKSAVQQALRPRVQRTFFDLFGDGGSKAVAGRDGWWFFRPDLRYLLEPDRAETGDPHARWAPPSDGTTRRDSVVRAIVRVRDQLMERNIQLLVVPVPGKPSVYPDRLTSRMAAHQAVQSPTAQLLLELRRKGVETVDLFTAFQSARQASSPANELYLAHDTHWTPRGAKLAAERVAQRLHELGWAPGSNTSFYVQPRSVRRWGDIAEMTQIPRLARTLGAQVVDCEQVCDPALGPLVPTPSDRPGTYRYAAKKPSVLVLGDSFSRIYQFPEPPSLGEATSDPGKGAAGSKRLLPGSAGFVSLLALALQTPVDAIFSDGGASTDVRRKLSTNPEILEGKKVVIWEFVERDVALGKQGWEDVALPPKLDS